MNIGVICNVISKECIAAIAVDKETGAIGYVSIDDTLENIIEALLDEKELDMPVTENIDEHEIIRLEKVKPTDSFYLMAINYHLPDPWKVLGVHYINGDLEEVLQEVYEHIITRGEDNE